ncbi:hypothetical protein [Methylobacterium sp. SD274]|uniref:hypothetical protein n=1 Tax=Methylobacterium sp. SD274 TaxID=2782009 RepID=UPI001FEE025E|nr:hypothetical protein [Methylobacterium sp. SD274]
MRRAHRTTLSGHALVHNIGLGDALTAGAAVAEIRGGVESAARRAIEVAGPIVKRVKSWSELHRELARQHIFYQAKGSGAVLVLDGVMVKASTFREAGRSKLEKRFGPFEPAFSTPANHGNANVGNEDAVRPAPGIDENSFAVSCKRKQAAVIAHHEYRTIYAPFAFAPMLMAAVAGGAPRAAPSARDIAKELGRPKPKRTPVARVSAPGLHPKSLLTHYETALQADCYRIIAERSGAPSSHRDLVGAATGPDRLFQITPRPMTGVAAAWPELETAAGAPCSLFLQPVSTTRHHVVLSGLAHDDLAHVRTRHAPALVLESADHRYEVVLTSEKLGLPYEAAAVAAAAKQLREFYSAERGRYGLRIRKDGVRREGREREAEPSPAYAQIVDGAGTLCSFLKSIIKKWIITFINRLGLGAGSRLGRGWPSDGEPEPENAPVYWAHRADILAHWEGRWPDASRVDSLIARRMQTNGHAEAAVANVITACAPAVERLRRYDWIAYGRRAAAHAFHDTEDTCWAFDRCTTMRWRELEEDVKARAVARKIASPPPIDVVIPPWPGGEMDTGKARRAAPAAQGAANGRGGGYER